MSSELPQPQSTEVPKEAKEESKHKVLFLTEEDAAIPSKVDLAENDEHPPGLILSNGDINWNCPCLGGMAIGPCGIEFRDAFSCFHYSEAEIKGSECIEKFAEMQKCMQERPELFAETTKKDEDTEKESEAADAALEEKEAPSDEYKDTSEDAPKDAPSEKAATPS